MGVIELMAVGNAIPDRPLTMESAPLLMVLMLAVLGVAVVGIVRAIPRGSRVPALRLAPADGR